jgi:hypothetical protein
VSGTIHYYSNAAPVNAANVQLQGSTAIATQTDINGQYAFSGVSAGNWQIQPSKAGDAGAGISTLDAVYVLQAMAGSRTFTAAQLLACDVTGNGSLSTLDAVLILQLKVGLVTSFPVAQACGSDWAFIPGPAGQTAPHMTISSCQAGTIALQSLASQADNQDFSAVLFGDCTGNWQPSTGSGAASRRTATGVGIGHAQRRGTHLRVPLVVERTVPFLGLDIEIAFDPTRLRFRGARRVGRASQALLAANERRPGLVALSFANSEPLPSGAVAVLLLEETSGHSGERTIHVRSANVANE